MARAVRRASIVLGLGVLFVAGSVRGDEVTVPLDLQVQLLGRVTRYERGYVARGTAQVQVLVLARHDSAESQRVAAQLSAALGRAGNLGGRSIVLTRHEFQSEADLAALLTRSHPDILYIAAGLGESVPAITRAVGSSSVLTVSAVGSDVDRGIVLGFELAASRPQIAINLEHARTQQQNFSAQLLHLARVVR